MANDVTILRNISLPSSATAGQTSTVDEPSVANNGQQIYFSGNWYAARSLNDTSSWQYLSPYTTFPRANNGFCCDQTLIYDPSRNLTIWLLQYSRGSAASNTLRLAVKRGTGGSVYDFYHDLVPGNVNPSWADEWFDYNSAALSNNYLYVTTNVFTGEDFTRAAVFRIPLDGLASGGPLTYNLFSTTSNGSLRCTQGATDVMYFGDNMNGNKLRVFTWPESSTTVSMTDVAVTPWTRGAYSAPGPDNNNWLGRLDDRITGAYLADGLIGFLWSANVQSGRPFPYVRVVVLDAVTKQLRSEPDIWTTNTAYAYPDACPNNAGIVAVTLFRGGGPYYPSHLVGVANNGSWALTVAKSGTNGPADGKWGDYLTCRPHSPDRATWSATGFTLQGGTARANVQPRYVQFGASSTVTINSVAFPGVDLRMDGTGVTVSSHPGGTVNCQWGAGPWEKFRLVPQADGTYAIASISFPGVYLRMDGRGVTQPTDLGGGTVNCQWGVGPWEKFRLVRQTDGTTAIASVAFPGVYLRMNGTGVTQSNNPGGIVNCQWGVRSWEKFRIDPA